MRQDNLKDYVSVATRIGMFRADHPRGRIITVMTHSEPITFRSEVYLEGDESPVATGHASENGGMGNNREESVEKVETASVGRALAFLGYEIKNGIASREEMEKHSGTERKDKKEPSSNGPGVDTVKRIVSEMNLTKTQFADFQKLPALKGRSWSTVLLSAHEEGCDNYDRLLEFVGGLKPVEGQELSETIKEIFQVA